jgi:hypothetical protein
VGSACPVRRWQASALVEAAEGSLHLLTLDVDELVQIARSRLTRTLTDTECDTYRFDPCPTLEAIKTGSPYRHICATGASVAAQAYSDQLVAGTDPLG